MSFNNPETIEEEMKAPVIQEEAVEDEDDPFVMKD
jgi:hypothetical protein